MDPTDLDSDPQHCCCRCWSSCWTITSPPSSPTRTCGSRCTRPPAGAIWRPSRSWPRTARTSAPSPAQARRPSTSPRIPTSRTGWSSWRSSGCAWRPSRVAARAFGAAAPRPDPRGRTPSGAPRCATRWRRRKRTWLKRVSSTWSRSHSRRPRLWMIRRCWTLRITASLTTTTTRVIITKRSF